MNQKIKAPFSIGATSRMTGVTQKTNSKLGSSRIYTQRLRELSAVKGLTGIFPWIRLK